MEALEFGFEDPWMVDDVRALSIRTKRFEGGWGQRILWSIYWGWALVLEDSELGSFGGCVRCYLCD